MGERIPTIARNGIPLERVNPQPDIQKNAETASDWEYKEEAQYLYRMASLLKDRLIDPILHTDRKRLPDPVISFENLRNQNTLAAYTLARNPQGLLFEITMNTQHYIVNTKDPGQIVWQFGKWAQLETLLHEQIHLWQQNYGKHPYKPGSETHNKEFVEKCNSLGLHPKLGPGYHVHLATEPFSLIMKELGNNPPNLFKKPKDWDKDWFEWWLEFWGKKRKGKSTLKKWVCPNCDLKVRIGIKGNPELTHNPCGEVLVKADGLSHIVYDTKQEANWSMEFNEGE